MQPRKWQLDSNRSMREIGREPCSAPISSSPESDPTCMISQSIDLADDKRGKDTRGHQARRVGTIWQPESCSAQIEGLACLGESKSDVVMVWIEIDK